MSLFLRCHGYRVQNYYKSLHLYIATCPFSIAVCNGIPDSLFTEYVDKIKSHSCSSSKRTPSIETDLKRIDIGKPSANGMLLSMYCKHFSLHGAIIGDNKPYCNIKLNQTSLLLNSLKLDG